MSKLTRKIKSILHNIIKTRNKLFLSGRIKATLRDIKTGKIKQIVEVHNIIPTVGLTAIARRLGNIGSKSNEGMITYGAVGSGSNTPASSDTTMENEIARKLIADSENTNNVILIETYFNSSEGNGDLTKFALFGEDASASADSGTMFEHVDFDSTITKTSNDDLTVQSYITISNE
jgi:hypothetical protein